MKAVETAKTIGSSAFASHRSLAPDLMVARLIWRRMGTYQLLSLLAVCLLAASTNNVWGQCWCGPPGIICCNVGVAAGCEPITTPTARAMCPSRAAPRQRGSARVAPPAVAPPALGGVPQGFDPRIQDQIKPLNCPRSFLRTGET